VATVALYQYSYYEPSGFSPGEVRMRWYGPWDWNGKAVVVTAMPFDSSTSHRELIVDYGMQTTPNEPVGDKYVHATIRNVGRDTLYIYAIELAEIAP
jgi:hypothetical protein